MFGAQRFRGPHKHQNKGFVSSVAVCRFSVAGLRAQSPSLAITLWRTVRANDAKATAFQGRCERVAPLEFLSLIT
jgi:hypothetical protein